MRHQVEGTQESYAEKIINASGTTVMPEPELAAALVSECQGINGGGTASQVQDAREGSLSACFTYVSRRLSATVQPGSDCSEYALRVGTVRMEDHHEHEKILADLADEGFNVRYVARDYEVGVLCITVINEENDPIEQRRYINLLPGMRHLDLLHELDHVKQLKRMGYQFSNWYVKRVANGREKRVSYLV